MWQTCAVVYLLVVFFVSYDATAFISGGLSCSKRLQQQNAATSMNPPTSPWSTKEKVLAMLENTPRNAPTSRKTTNEILDIVRELELECPTPDEEVLQKLSGSWELLWTAQDPEAPESNNRFRSWINPLENQSYSNNPGGRYSPILPREIQDRLEKAGLTQSTADLRSIQSVDLASQKVRNVVNLMYRIPSLLFKRKPQRASLTVAVDFHPDDSDPRKINVKFESCRVRAGKSVDFSIPLGVVGPTGWLRTVFIDDSMRVTRGHKGSVFILQRPAKKENSNPL